MEYAILFSLMGTWIAWLHYRNYKLLKGVKVMALMMDKIISKEVEINRIADGFEITVKTKGE